MKFDSVNKFRSGENKVENNAGQSCVPHILGSVPVRVVVITGDTRFLDLTLDFRLGLDNTIVLTTQQQNEKCTEY